MKFNETLTFFYDISTSFELDIFDIFEDNQSLLRHATY